MTERKFNPRAEQSRFALLIFGGMLIYFGVSQLPIIWTSKSELKQLKGTLQSANSYVNAVTDTDNYGVTHETQKAELIFYLNEFKQKYYLVENIGTDNQNDKYDKILNGLNQADTISVWIKKDEVSEWQPKVFEIDDDDSTLLDFDKVRLRDSPLFLFLTILGIGCIAFYFWADNPTKIRRAFGIKDDN